MVAINTLLASTSLSNDFNSYGGKDGGMVSSYCKAM